MTGRAIKRSRRLAPAPSRATANRAREWRLHAVTAERAVTAIRPGDRVFVGSACATPRTLLGALEAMVTPLAGVQLVHFLTDGAGTERDGRCRTADVLATNTAMLAVFRRAGCHMTTRLVEGTYEVQMLFPR